MIAVFECLRNSADVITGRWRHWPIAKPYVWQCYAITSNCPYVRFDNSQYVQHGCAFNFCSANRRRWRTHPLSNDDDDDDYWLRRRVGDVIIAWPSTVETALCLADVWESFVVYICSGKRCPTIERGGTVTSPSNAVTSSNFLTAKLETQHGSFELGSDYISIFSVSWTKH